MFSGPFQLDTAHSTWEERFKNSIYDRQNSNRQVFDKMPQRQHYQIPPLPEFPAYSPYSDALSFGLSPQSRPPDWPPPPPSPPPLQAPSPPPQHRISYNPNTEPYQDGPPQSNFQPYLPYPSPSPSQTYFPTHVSQPIHPHTVPNSISSSNDPQPWYNYPLTHSQNSHLPAPSPSLHEYHSAQVSPQLYTPSQHALTLPFHSQPAPQQYCPSPHHQPLVSLAHSSPYNSPHTSGSLHHQPNFNLPPEHNFSPYSASSLQQVSNHNHQPHSSLPLQSHSFTHHYTQNSPLTFTPSAPNNQHYTTERTPASCTPHHYVAALDSPQAPNSSTCCDHPNHTYDTTISPKFSQIPTREIPNPLRVTPPPLILEPANQINMVEEGKGQFEALQSIEDKQGKWCIRSLIYVIDNSEKKSMDHQMLDEGHGEENLENGIYFETGFETKSSDVDKEPGKTHIKDELSGNELEKSIELCYISGSIDITNADGKLIAERVVDNSVERHLYKEPRPHLSEFSLPRVNIFLKKKRCKFKVRKKRILSLFVFVNEKQIELKVDRPFKFKPMILRAPKEKLGCYFLIAFNVSSWFDLLGSQFRYIVCSEFLGCMSVSRATVTSLVNYGEQIFCAVTTASRLAPFLGTRLNKDKGSSCLYIIALDPKGTHVANPIPRVVQTDWLHGKVREKDDTFWQWKWVDVFESIRRVVVVKMKSDYTSTHQIIEGTKIGEEINQYIALKGLTEILEVVGTFSSAIVAEPKEVIELMIIFKSLSKRHDYELLTFSSQLTSEVVGSSNEQVKDLEFASAPTTDHVLDNVFGEDYRVVQHFSYTSGSLLIMGLTLSPNEYLFHSSTKMSVSFYQVWQNNRTWNRMIAQQPVVEEVSLIVILVIYQVETTYSRQGTLYQLVLLLDLVLIPL